MSDITQRKKRYTVEEYLEFEKQGEVRYEFFHGEVFAMAGASRVHNELAGNTYTTLKNTLRGKGCKTYMESVKVELVNNKFYVYPDVVVTCDPKDKDDPYFVKKPSVIVEVLSKSTSILDTKGKKFLEYIKLPSLNHYVVVSQDFVYVGVYSRNKDGWQYQVYEQLDQEIPLDSLGISLKVGDIYEDVELSLED